MCSSSPLCLKMTLIDYLSILRFGFKVSLFLGHKLTELECLKILQKVRSRDEGWKELYSKSVQEFAIPGDSRSRLQNISFWGLISELLRNLAKLSFEQLLLQAKNWPGRPAHEGLSKGRISGHFLDLIAARQKQ